MTPQLQSRSERALILAPHGRDASVAAELLTAGGFASEVCADLVALLREMECGGGFALVTDEALRTADLKDLSRWLADQPPWSDFAFIVLTVRGGGIERNPAARRYLDVLGNVSFLERPFHPTTLISLAGAALRARRRQYEARARLEALRDSETRYRTLFENIDEGFCIIEFFDGPHGPSSDYIHVEANPAYAHHAGIPNVVGQKVREMVPDEADAWVALYRRVLETGEPTRFERELVATGAISSSPPSGWSPPAAVRWRSCSATSRTAGAPRWRCATAKPACARSTPTSNVRWPNAHASAGGRGRSAPISSASSMPRGASPAPTRPGSNRSGGARRNWRGHLTPSSSIPTTWRRRRRPSRRCGGVSRCCVFENRYRRRDGAHRWISWVAVPEGEEVYCSGRDVTLEKAQAAELAERRAELDRLWALSEDMLARADYQGMMSAVSPAWTRILGWTETELLTRPYATFMHPDDMGPTLNALAAMSENGQAARFENRIATRDGDWKPIEWTVAPEEEGVNFIAVGRDLSAVKAREAELAVAQEALRQSQKLEAVGQLTGGVAHDFNNLLTIIKSSTDLLRRPNLADERRRRYMDAISETVDRAAKLTGQLLAFARRQALKPEAFDVARRVDAITDMLRTVVGSRIRISTHVETQDCYTEADISQFETALINMAVNARDAMNGEGRLTVTVRSIPELPPLRGHAGGPGPFVAVSVADTGEGIPADKLSQIFEPFFTTKEIGKGTGLGLSQVYGFVKQSGGDVAVESEVGKGATFTIYLPQIPGRPDRPPARTGPLDAASDGRGKKVLVVEDNIEVGRFSTQLLQDLGYATTWAANAGEALSLLDEVDGFDVVFSDVVMPGMGGVELGEEIRRRRPGLPVVLTSGYSHVLAEEGRHGFELLHKPYAVEELSRILRRVIRR